MICYDIQVERSGRIFCCISKQFADVKGYGDTDAEAIGDVIAKINKAIDALIRAGKPFPKAATSARKKGNRFCLPAAMELTMYLHEVMLLKKVSRGQLARLLALTDSEVKATEWNLQKIIKLEPDAVPKYKNVQRLLDINHNSTIAEISEAFRVLDCSIDLQIIQKNADSRTPVIRL